MGVHVSVSCLHASAAVSVCTWVDVYLSETLPPPRGVYPTVGLLDVGDLSHLLSSPHAMSGSSRTAVHPHQQRTRVPISPHPHQHFWFARLWVLWGFDSSQREAVKWYLSEALMCVSVS